MDYETSFLPQSLFGFKSGVLLIYETVLWSDCRVLYVPLVGAKLTNFRDPFTTYKTCAKRVQEGLGTINRFNKN